MRKIISAIILILVALATPIHAQNLKGEKTLGVSGGYASYNNGAYTSIYFQYSFSRHFRIAPDIGYIFRHEGKSAFNLNIDAHVPFRLAKGFSIYPLAGFTFNNWNYISDKSTSRAGLNLGAGLDIYLTSFLKMTINGKYSFMNDTSGAFAGLSLGYMF